MKKASAHSAPVRIALIGAGAIGGVWAHAAQHSRGVFVRAVVDSDLAKAEALARRFKKCAALTRAGDVLKDPNIDAVVIAVPHRALAPLSRQALRAGKHVLCEKPAGISSREAAKNQTLAQKKRRVYMIGFNHRFHAGYLKAKSLCDKGVIGSLLFIRARYGFGGRPGYEKEWRLNKRIAGGGELIDQGIHMLDISRWFLGDIRDVRGFAPNLYWGGTAEDNAFVTARMQSGAVAQIHVSWTNWDWIHCFEVFGTKGYLRIDGLDSRYHGPERLTIGTHDPRKKGFPKEKTVVFASEHKEDSFVRELSLFAKAVRGTKVQYPNGTDAAQALRAVESIYRKK